MKNVSVVPFIFLSSAQILFSTGLTLTRNTRLFHSQHLSSRILRRSTVNPIRLSANDDMTSQDGSQTTTITDAISPQESGSAVAKPNLFGPNSSPPGILRKSFPTFPWHSLPNILTFMRCLAIPALVVLFYQPGWHIATALIFGFASVTDWFDGYLARRWDITSSFGAFLDPVADKLMVSTALILLAGRHGAKVAIPTCIIMSRELAVSALREWMAQRGQRDSVKVGFQGKVKTAATMVSLNILLLIPHGAKQTSWLSSLLSPGLFLLNLCTVITVTSGSVYFRDAAPALSGKGD